MFANQLEHSNSSRFGFIFFKENPVEFEFLNTMKLVREKKPGFQMYHGPILRSGNTPDDIGKPAIDLLRLSLKPVMILKGQITVNNTDKFRRYLARHGVKEESEMCTEQILQSVIQVIYKVLNAVTAVLLRCTGRIPFREESSLGTLCG